MASLLDSLKHLIERCRRLTKLGGRLAANEFQEKGVIFANVTALLGIFLVIVMTFAAALAGGPGIIRQLLACGLFLVCSLLAHSFGFFTAGRSLVIFTINGLIFSLSCAFGREAELHSTLLALFFMPLCFFSINEKKPLLATALVAPFSWFLLMASQFSLVAKETFNPSFVTFFSYCFLGLSFVATGYLFKRILDSIIHFEHLAEKNLELRNRMVSMVGHDINGLLSIIGGSLKLIERSFPVKAQPTGKRYYESAMKAFLSIEQLVENVRIMRTASCIHQTINLEPISFDECIEYVNFMFLDKMDTKGLQLIAKDMTDKSLGFNVDPVIFPSSVLSNIVSNAVKYSPPGGVIHIFLEQKQQDLVLTIEDNGIGMSAETQATLFSPRYTTSSLGTAGELEGTGIGMFIVKKYIEEFNGRIEVESKEDGGTSITLTLPGVALSRNSLKLANKAS